MHPQVPYKGEWSVWFKFHLQAWRLFVDLAIKVGPSSVPKHASEKSFFIFLSSTSTRTHWINNNKCISKVPNPSMTIYTCGSKHFTWNFLIPFAVHPSAWSATFLAYICCFYFACNLYWRVSPQPTCTTHPNHWTANSLYRTAPPGQKWYDPFPQNTGEHTLLLTLEESSLDGQTGMHTHTHTDGAIEGCTHAQMGQ